tara:strand:- start:65 stop:352 length:288 start_codon:yes stop_codon:yes gene_type:complete
MTNETKTDIQDFVAITADGEVVDNSYISWSVQMRLHNVVAGVNLYAAKDGEFEWVAEEWYGPECDQNGENLHDKIRNSELFNHLRTAIQDSDLYL